LRLQITDILDDEYALNLMIGMVCVGPAKPLKVELLVNGEVADTRCFADSAAGGRWSVALPAHVVAGGEIDLALLIDDPRSPQDLGWSTDDRALGVHVRTLSVTEWHRRVRVGDKLVFTEGSQAECLLGDGWAELEVTGVWTLGTTASVAFRLVDPHPAGVDLVLEVMPFVTREHRKLLVEAWVRGGRVAAHVFRHGEPSQLLRVHLPATVIGEDGRVSLTLRMHEPARPADVGFNEDPRPLGVHLQSLTVSEPNAGPPRKSGVATLRELRRQLGRSLRA
jgi:hypothetical protein